MLLGEVCSWTFVLVTLGLPTPRLAAGQKCPSQSLEDVVVDIQSSLARGIRGSEPTYALSEDACLHSCCSTRSIAGDKACNLMIFDARKAAGQPNCYLFFCPGEASCPLKPAPAGLRTHRVSPDGGTLAGTAISHQDLAANDGPPGGASVTPSPPKPTPRRAVSSQVPGAWGASQLLPRSTLAPQGHSQPVPLSLVPATAHTALMRPGPATHSPPAAPDPVTSPHEGSAPPSGIPRPTPAPGTPQMPPAPSQPPTAPMSADLPHVVTSAVAPSVEAEGSQEAEAPGATSRPTAGTGHTRGLATISLSAAAATTLAWGPGEARGPGEATGRPSPPGRDGLRFERWLLLGTLLAGVLLLGLGLVFLGRALLQALHTRPYSRLDYLINGVYVGI
ncbi:MANSC domain-containing protein 1 isoform 1-T3 [Thomomys bottae]